MTIQSTNPSALPGDRVPVPMTAQSLLDNLSERFGTEIAESVRSALAIDSSAGPLDLQQIRLAIDMALDAELLLAGASFTSHPTMSALAGTAGFRRAAEQAGIVADAMDIEHKLRVDAAFLCAWRSLAGAASPSSDESRAQAVMAGILVKVAL